MWGIIAGTGITTYSFFEQAKERTVETPYGSVILWECSEIVYLRRHGKNGNTPPHAINHHAHLAALKKLGVTKIIAINSTGSLKKAIQPGTIMIPDDYFNFSGVPTFFDQELRFTIPGFDQELRRLLITTANQHSIAVIPEGVYVQSSGPTLETRAEIKFMQQIGDIVGMTMAKEAILAKELDIGYASICSVDNYANGVIDQKLSLDKIREKAQENQQGILMLLEYFFSP